MFFQESFNKNNLNILAIVIELQFVYHYLDLFSSTIANTADFTLSESSPTGFTASTPVINFPSVKEKQWKY